MYYLDYHNHSELSPDSQAPLAQMVQAAIHSGISEMCLTDHYDTLNGDGSRRKPFNWAPAVAQIKPIQEQFKGQIVLKLGLELGCGHLDTTVVDTAPPELDFILGSIHNQSEAVGGGDMYFIHYSNKAICHKVLDDYFHSVLTLAGTDTYDVLSHLIYPLRYMERDGQNISLTPYHHIIEQIMTTAIHAGKGIEINAYNGRTLAPWLPVLKQYKSLGGEILTTGSDAHAPQNMGKGIRELVELAQEAGFRYLCSYEKRKPTFLTID